MTRKDLQALSVLRLEEAKNLLRHGFPDGAYYIAGYAAECAIKACVAKRTMRHEFPDLPKAQASWRHDLAALIAVAELGPAFEAARKTDPRLAGNWAVVREWSEHSRYDRKSAIDATELVNALIERKHGVLQWLKRRW